MLVCSISGERVLHFWSDLNILHSWEICQSILDLSIKSICLIDLSEIEFKLLSIGVNQIEVHPSNIVLLSDIKKSMDCPLIAAYLLQSVPEASHVVKMSIVIC